MVFPALFALCLVSISSPDYQTREWAEAHVGVVSSATLREARSNSDDPETRARLDRVITRLMIREAEALLPEADLYWPDWDHIPDKLRARLWGLPKLEDVDGMPTFDYRLSIVRTPMYEAYGEHRYLNRLWPAHRQATKQAVIAYYCRTGDTHTIRAALAEGRAAEDVREAMFRDRLDRETKWMVFRFIHPELTVRP